MIHRSSSLVLLCVCVCLGVGGGEAGGGGGSITRLTPHTYIRNEAWC